MYLGRKPSTLETVGVSSSEREPDFSILQKPHTSFRWVWSHCLYLMYLFICLWGRYTRSWVCGLRGQLERVSCQVVANAFTHLAIFLVPDTITSKQFQGTLMRLQGGSNKVLCSITINKVKVLDQWISTCGSWLWRSEDQAGLELRDLTASASWVL